MCLCLLKTVQFFQKRFFHCCINIIHHGKLSLHTVQTAVSSGPMLVGPLCGLILSIGTASSAQHLCSLGTSNPIPDALANFAFSRGKKLSDRQRGTVERAENQIDLTLVNAVLQANQEVPAPLTPGSRQPETDPPQQAQLRGSARQHVSRRALEVPTPALSSPPEPPSRSAVCCAQRLCPTGKAVPYDNKQ